MLISWIIEMQSRVLDRKFINLTWHAMDTSYRPPPLLLVRVDYIHHWWAFIQYPSFHRFYITIMSWWLCNCGLDCWFIRWTDNSSILATFWPSAYLAADYIMNGVLGRLYISKAQVLVQSFGCLSVSCTWIGRYAIAIGDNLNRRDSNRIVFRESWNDWWALNWATEYKAT